MKTITKDKYYTIWSRSSLPFYSDNANLWVIERTHTLDWIIELFPKSKTGKKFYVDSRDLIYWPEGYLPNLQPEQCIVDYCKTHSKSDAFLYNNRLLGLYTRPTQKHLDQYDANWRYINIQDA